MRLTLRGRYVLAALTLALAALIGFATAPYCYNPGTGYGVCK